MLLVGYDNFHRSARQIIYLGRPGIPVAIPQVWNSLPSAIRAEPLLFTFQQELKTFLYRWRFVDR